jgi:hypothetical protein
MEKFEVTSSPFLYLVIHACFAGCSQYWLRFLWVRFAVPRKEQRHNGCHQAGDNSLNIIDSFVSNHNLCLLSAF